MGDLFQTEENATPLTEEEKLALIPSLSTRAELNKVERSTILEARIWFKGVWTWAGHYRKTERNLGWEVHRLTEGIYHAFADARTWLKYDTYPLHETAVRLHHQLVRVHPWPNGNGRHARLMADILVQSRGGDELTWGAGSDIVTLGEVRARYIAALKKADDEDFAPLLAFARS